MPDNKRHHYVPRFYLKRFSRDEKTICLYNLKSKKKVIGASLNKQCYKDYFYGKDQILEHLLEKIETVMKSIFKLIDEIKEPPPRNSPFYQFLIHFIAIQHGRTQYAAEAMNEMTDKMAKYILSPMAESNDIDLNKVKIGYKNVAQHSVALNIQMYPILIDLHCKLLINCTDVEFVLSDNPIVFYNKFMDFRKNGSNTGFASKGLQIFFPIDPHNLILFYDHIIYRVGKDNENIIKITDARDIHEINTLQTCSSLDNIYFLDQDFNCNSLHKKAKPFLRKIKANVVTFSEYKNKQSKSKLLAMSNEDIRTNLHLSFLTIRKSAKEWRDKLRSQGLRPSDIVRNEQLCKDFEEFSDAVKRKQYNIDDFLNFLNDKYKSQLTM
jgi:Protein of unknown function (DUF4238)